MFNGQNFNFQAKNGVEVRLGETDEAHQYQGLRPRGLHRRFRLGQNGGGRVQNEGRA